MDQEEEPMYDDLSNVQQYTVYDYEYDNNEQLANSNHQSSWIVNTDLYKLLKSWKLEMLYDTCLGQSVDMDVLTKMRFEHANEMVKDYPIGVKVLFTHELDKWQKSKTCSENLQSSEPQSIVQPTVKVEKISTRYDHLNLNEVFHSTQGTMIMDYFKLNKKLNDRIRTLLVELIINHIITKEISMTVNLAESISNQIVSIFPTEIKDVYFMRDGPNKNPKGKLYGKFYNSVRLLKSSGLDLKNKPAKKTKLSNKRPDLHFEPEENIDHMLDQIFNDMDVTFPQLLKLWKATTNYRLKDIQQLLDTNSIIKKWKSFMQPMGFKLVEVDFKSLYPQCDTILSSSLEEHHSNLINLMDDKIKDSASRVLLESIKSERDISENRKNASILYLLHAVFVPTNKKCTRDETGKKNLLKYSIKDSQNSFLIIRPSAVEVEEYIKTRLQKKEPIQPFVIIIGSLNSPKEILVFFDCIKYKLFSIASALDVCFKIIHVFNLEYPAASSMFWLFVQKFFYKINTIYDKPYPNLNQILYELSTITNM